jgi:hypothetical protein
MLLYLDNCCLNRPFDDQLQIRIRLETDAKLVIQDGIRVGDYKLAWSYILDYENSENPFPERRETIQSWREFASTDTDGSQSIRKMAESLHQMGIKAKDALHVACAVKQKCEYFITTDRFLIKKLINFEEIKVVNPVDFILLQNR